QNLVIIYRGFIMKCSNCQTTKLSKEFPLDTITEKCTHVPTWCLKCLIFHLQKGNTHNEIKCPECPVQLTQSEINGFKIAWEKAPFKIDIGSLFKNSRANNTNNNSSLNDPATQKGEFFVVLLSGDKYSLKLEDIQTVKILKAELTKKIKVDGSKQKLLHKGVELQVRQQNGQGENKLSTYGIRAGDHIQLIVTMYAISRDETISNLSFDLYWGYPLRGKDYLDGTCLIYTGRDFWKKYDYKERYDTVHPYIRHSGDVMDDPNRRGHHRITIKLDKLPDVVNKLYFVLSAWKCPHIGDFIAPSFKLYDEDSSDKKQLCNYTIQTAANSQAVIMCAVIKKDDGSWDVVEVGRVSNGNARDYIIKVK
ncbi:20943_t:CDS:2, partial [Dentiscutata erythropus]